MSPSVWTEVRYGTLTSSVRLARLQDREVLAAFRDRALERARLDAEESRNIDPVIHIEDQAELRRLEQLFRVIAPDSD